MPTLTLVEAREHVAAALMRAGAGRAMTESTARALVLAEAQGLASHGLSRVAQYATHLRNGRVEGSAVARLVKQKGATAVVDAGEGLAFPACELAVEEAMRRAGEFGVGFVGVARSHHAGVLVDHLRPVGEAGLVGLAFANSPAAMPAAGGRHPIFGTNPIAAIFPRRAAPTGPKHADTAAQPPAAGGASAIDAFDPLLIDLSLSEVARGKLMVAAKEAREIPPGWALDREGRPTTDPRAGLEGSMLPIGALTSPKGALLALVVELLVTALIGASYGFEASSFFVDEGNRPNIGQAFIVIDPEALAGREAFLDRIEVLIAEILEDDGVRMPGERRKALLAQAESDGLRVSEALLASLLAA